MADVRVLVVADDPLGRAGLATLIGEAPGCMVVGRTTAGDLPEAATTYQAEVVAWDLGWEPGRSLPGVSESADSGISLAVLLPDSEHALLALAAGARAVLSRSLNASQLGVALAAVAHDLQVIDPALGINLATVRSRGDEPLAEPLTGRELEVLQLMAEGLANKGIAGRLAISEHTVKFHVNAILGKLGVQSRTEAVVRASRLGLILL